MINKPPKRKPILTTIQLIWFCLKDKSIAGFSKEKKLLAIIIPAPKDKKQSNTFFDILLKIKTVHAPNRLLKYVNVVASNASIIGFIFISLSILSPKYNMPFILLHLG